MLNRIAAALIIASFPTAVRAAPPDEAPDRCWPSPPCWPTAEEWQKLRTSLRGKLEQPTSPWQACTADATGAACAATLRDLKNPYYLQDQSGGTESAGWLDAWTAAPSAYAVAAESAEDIAAAVSFARDHNLRLVIKGTGHDYLGRSSAPDSLLIWTHKMRKITVHDSFVGRGCPTDQAGLPAVTVEAGTRWREAYQAGTGKACRYR